jgi:hypothetical protein
MVASRKGRAMSHLIRARLLRPLVAVGVSAALLAAWTATPASAVPYNVTVVIAGDGSGSVTSSPPGISCPPTCSASFEENTTVTLTAVASSGSFAGWTGGGCSGTGVCSHTVTAPVTITATFNTPTGKNVSLRVSDKVVDEGDRVTFKARVTPCAGHEGDQIILKGGGASKSKASNASCKARWRVKMKKTARFRAVSPQQDIDHLGGKSKRIRVLVIPKPEPSGGGGGGGNCDPSYPTVCIPPPPPDLDCADVNASGFKVVGSDPHGFDGDNDGIGCE